MNENWFQVPEELQVDPMIKFLIEERRKAMETMRGADEALKNYVLRNAAAVPEDLLPGLTKLQAKTLDFIVRCYKKTGQSPTSMEIMRHMDWSANNSAVNAVHALCRKGYIHKTKGKWRSLVPLFTSKRERITQSKDRKKNDE